MSQNLIPSVALLVLFSIGGRLVVEAPALLARSLRRVRSRRAARSELSLVGALAELLLKDTGFWTWLDHRRKLNIEGTL